MYGILAHFLQGGHKEGRRLGGPRDDSVLRPYSRGTNVHVVYKSTAFLSTVVIVQGKNT